MHRRTIILTVLTVLAAVSTCMLILFQLNRNAGRKELELVYQKAVGYSVALAEGFREPLETARYSALCLGMILEEHGSSAVEDPPALLSVFDLQLKCLLQSNESVDAAWIWRTSSPGQPQQRFLRRCETGKMVSLHDGWSDPRVRNAVTSGQEHVIGPVTLNGATGTGQAIIMVAPIESEGRLLGAIGLEIGLDAIRSLLPVASVVEIGYASLLAPTGEVLVHPVEDLVGVKAVPESDMPLFRQAVAGQRASGWATSLRTGEMALKLYEPIRVSAHNDRDGYWIVALVASKRSLFAQSRHMLLLVACGGLTVTLLGFSCIQSLQKLMAARRQLLASRAEFVNVVRDAPLLVCRFDSEGTILFVNDSFAEYFGGKAESFKGTDGYMNIHPESQKELRAILATVTPDNPVYSVDMRLLPPGGQPRWTRWIARAIFNTAGEIEVVQGMGQDIDEQKRMEAAFAQSQTEKNLILENVSDGVMYMDVHQRVMWANARAAHMAASEPEGMIGRHCFEIYAGQTLCCENCPVANAISTGHTSASDILLSDGRVLHVTGVPVRDESGKVIGAVETLRDITAEKHLEYDLIKARDAAESADRAKSEFLANMSHEIRTPMNGIIGMTDLALETQLDDEQRDYIQTIKNCGEALLGVLNDILDFSKIVAGKMTFVDEPFSLRKAVTRVMSTFGAGTDDKGVEMIMRVDPAIPDILIGDELRLCQILSNLVGNAAKFTSEGEIELRIDLLSVDDSTAHLEFTVRDTGIGIAPELLDRIFHPFEQADMSATRRFGGTGLGLAISSRLAKMFNGRFWADSTPGEGSAFHLSVHLECQADTVPTLTMSGRALLADPNACSREAIGEMLAACGLEVCQAADLAEAAECAKNGPFTAVFVDADLPGVDDFDYTTLGANGTLPPVTALCRMGVRRRNNGRFLREVPLRLGKPVCLLCLLGMLERIKDGTWNTPEQERADQAAAEEEKLCAATGLETPPPISLNILLAEDNRTNQVLARKLLESLGHQVTIVDNGRDAISSVVSKEFDLVLMDVQMPVLNGLEAARQLRQHAVERVRRVSIIAMTAHAMSGDREKCLASGMDGYLAKPVSRKALAEVIAQVVAERQAANNAEDAWDMDEPDAAIPMDDEAPQEADDDAADSSGLVVAGGLGLDRQILDVEDAVARFDGDREFFVTMCEVIHHDLETMLSGLDEALAGEEPESLVRAVHSIKGAVSNISAFACAEAARCAECAARDGRLDAAQHACVELKVEIQRLRPALAKVITSSAESRPAEATSDEA